MEPGIADRSASRVMRRLIRFSGRDHLSRVVRHATAHVTNRRPRPQLINVWVSRHSATPNVDVVARTLEDIASAPH